jgi:hypothetical protein
MWGSMTFFSRPLKLSRRPRLLVAGTLALAAVALGAGATPAGAVVTSTGGTTVGIQPRIGESYVTGVSPTTYANNGGNPVVHGESTFAIYWDPTDHYHSDWQRFTDEYFHEAGNVSGFLGSVFAVATQYTDKTNTPATYHQVFKGAYTDTHAYPGSACADPSPFESADLIGPGHTEVCLTEPQVAAEVESFVAAHKLPTGMGSTYFLMTPPGVAVCLDGGGPAGHCSDYEQGNEESYENSFCSYHGAINPSLPSGGPNTLLYAVIPWSAGNRGDKLLTVEDSLRTGWECQDGGINPAGKHGYELEKPRKKTAEEEKEFEEASAEAKEEKSKQEALEGPHAEEPNQNGCNNPVDGGCDAGLFDLNVNQIASEQINMITDPLLNAWQDSKGNENTDECRFKFGLVQGGSVAANLETSAGNLYDQILGTHNYYLNDVFNAAALQLPFPGVACLNGVNLDPHFTAPNPVNAEETVGLDGMESNLSLVARTAFDAKGSPTQDYATYTWNFGDGSAPVSGFAPGAPVCEAPWLSPCAASVFHAYHFGGTYNVTLTVKDVGANTASISHSITVVGPPPPPASSSSSSAGGGAGSGGPGGSSAAVKTPVATAVVLTKSLKSALKRGVLVSYSVDQQITGHVEVLLSRTMARRLGIAAPAASSLAAGSSPQVVVAKAFIRTTHGGRSKITLVFTSKTAKRLVHQHSLSLMLRLFVRNSANKAATVLGAFRLSK